MLFNKFEQKRKKNDHSLYVYKNKCAHVDR